LIKKEGQTMPGLYRRPKRSISTMPDKRFSRVLMLLMQELPCCFIKGPLKKPLKSSIYQDLLAHYRHETRFTTYELRKALHAYTQQLDYLQQITVDADCIDLQGQPCETVPEDRVNLAKRWLDKIQLSKTSTCKAK
jgi:sRNA-binding protein